MNIINNINQLEIVILFMLFNQFDSDALKVCRNQKDHKCINYTY